MFCVFVLKQSDKEPISTFCCSGNFCHWKDWKPWFSGRIMKCFNVYVYRGGEGPHAAPALLVQLCNLGSFNLSLPPLTQAMLKLAISVLKADFKYYLSWEWGGGGATSGISYEQVADWVPILPVPSLYLWDLSSRPPLPLPFQASEVLLTHFVRDKKQRW